MKILFKTALLVIVIIFIFTCGFYINFDAKSAEKISEDRYSVSVLDNKGSIIGVHLNNNEQWHLKSSEKIPEKLKIAVTVFEDKNFYSHNGIDFFAVTRAFYNNFKDGRRTGASTITMQAAKMLELKKKNIFKQIF